MSRLPEEYRALIVRENPGGFTRAVESVPAKDLPEHEVTVRVHYSSLNYKDALSATGNRGVTARYPHTPGIDAAGVVEESSDNRFRPGQKVIVTGYDLGMNTPGGFGEYIRVPGDWIVPLPVRLTLKESMIFGTAGFTAAYGVHKIVKAGISVDDGPVVVTGATGGVGSMAVAILSRIGYPVVAVTGKDGHHSFLRTLGASGVADRKSFPDGSGKPLLKGTWAAAIDTVGGSMLDTVIRQTRSGGFIACCGNILGNSLQTSILPFILRGISLSGIDSANSPISFKEKIWRQLSADWKPVQLQSLFREVTLDALSDEVDTILQGGQAGRVLVRVID